MRRKSCATHKLLRIGFYSNQLYTTQTLHVHELYTKYDAVDSANLPSDRYDKRYSL
jgi:hypothetical protein